MGFCHAQRSLNTTNLYRPPEPMRMILASAFEQNRSASLPSCLSPQAVHTVFSRFHQSCHAQAETTPRPKRFSFAAAPHPLVYFLSDDAHNPRKASFPHTFFSPLAVIFFTSPCGLHARPEAMPHSFATPTMTGSLCHNRHFLRELQARPPIRLALPTQQFSLLQQPQSQHLALLSSANYQNVQTKQPRRRRRMPPADRPLPTAATLRADLPLRTT